MTRIFRNPRTARKAKLIAAAALMLMVTGATYAYTASNTVGASNAGYGTGSVTGYNVTASSIHYTIDTANPGSPGISAMTFTVDNPAGDVKVQLTPGGNWYDCGATVGASAPYTVNCTTTAGGETTAQAVGANVAVVAVS